MLVTTEAHLTDQLTSGTPHPLDPLSFDEIEAAVSIFNAAAGANPNRRFAMTRLEEPTKAALAAYDRGEPLPRLAFLLVLDRSTGEAVEAIVDIGRGIVTSQKVLPLEAPPYGQPAIMLDDFFRCEAIVKADAGWRAAMTRRGLTPEDIEKVQVDPFSSGYFGRDFEKGARIVRAASYYRENLKDNGYAHPIEGVVAVVDLVRNKVVDLVDDEKIIPIPKKKRNYNRESFPET